MKTRSATRLPSTIGALMLVLALAACGASDDPPDPPPPPTALPVSLTVTTPTTRQALATDVAFGSNAIDPERKLSYRWDFGDGSTSVLPAPSHAFARGGSYNVRLTLSNEVGTSVQSSRTVTVADLAIVQGRVCSSSDRGGWCWQNPLPQGNPVNSYAWLDGQRGWAVGSQGTILKTSDGGQTWSAQTSGTRSELGRVMFVNDRVGWVSGSNGLVLRTSDGGSTWHSASVGADVSTYSLQAVDENTAWVNTFSVSYLTTDGGNHWQRVLPPAGSVSLHQSSPNTLWSTVFNSGSTSLLRSLDAGSSWQQVALPALAQGFTRSAISLRFGDAQRGVVKFFEFGLDTASQTFITREFTLLTQDGGATWSPLTRPPNVSAFADLEHEFTADGAIFVRNNYGTSTIDYTSDGGTTWRTMPRPAANGASSSSYVPYAASHVLLRNGDGRTYLTADACTNWAELSFGGAINRALNSVWFFDSREGLALTDDGNSLRTSDGGQTWLARVPEVPCCFGWRRLEFGPGSSTGWAIAYSGQIYRSTDRGRTWLSPVPQSSAPLGDVADYHFIDLTHGWALSRSPPADQGSLFTSTDGGASWQGVPSSNNLAGMLSLCFADRSHGVAVGAAGVAMLTSDGGISWRPRPTGSGSLLRKLVFVDAQTVVAVGENGTILRSTDRGQNWARAASPTSASLSDLRFISANVGHAVGAQGTLLSTSDGGTTWQDSSPDTRVELRGVFFIDESTGWAVGSNGAILATISGGR